MDTRPLRETRRRQLLSIEALADKAGVSTKTVVEIELGRQRPQLRTIAKLSAALDVDPLSIAEFRQTIEDPDAGKDRAA
jgi:transcriptional regulator with XRE-family HTH domain